jgi:hypothetical protein
MAAPEVNDPDDLYALDPADFVAARDQLAKRLRAEKQKDEASAVAKLRRPTPTAWALNRVARDQPDLVQAALDAGHRLRDATEAAVGGQRDELRAAMAEEQGTSRKVVDAAARHLGARAAGLTQRVAGTLRAAVLDDTVADELRRGVLATEHDASGFGFGGFDVAPARASGGRSAGGKASRAPRASAGPGPKRADAPRKGGARPTAQPSADKARDRAEAEERRAAERAERAAATAAREAERKRKAELKTRVRELRDKANDLDRAARRAEAEARKARTAADEATAELDAAREELDTI